MNNNQKYHIPVLLNECLEGLNISPEGIYIDVTFGGGGHSREIFKQLSPKGKLIAFDQDPDALTNTWEAENFTFISENFSYINNHLKIRGIQQVNGILADLGVSSHQFNEADRGFSFRYDANLDMRMDQSAEKTAETVINEYSEEELKRIFRSYGEINNAFRLVNEIIKNRLQKRIRTTRQLVKAIEPVAPRRKENKYFAQVFQAIRIEVNDEMKALENLLLQAEKLIRPGGRLVIISYHSLEDRLVKNFMKRGSLDGKINKDFYGNVLKPFTEINRKPIIPSEKEIEENSRARSAKLRIAERNGE